MVSHETLPTTFLLDLLFTLAVVHPHPLPVDPLAPIRPPPLPQLYLRHLLPLKIRDPSHLLPPTKTLPLSPRLTPTYRPRQVPLLPRRPNLTRPLPPSRHRMSSFSCYVAWLITSADSGSDSTTAQSSRTRGRWSEWRGKYYSTTPIRTPPHSPA